MNGAPFETYPDDQLLEAVRAPWPAQNHLLPNGLLVPRAPESQYYLGIPTLPIAADRERIIAAHLEHPVIVVEAPTGNGKSLQLPPYLLELGIYGTIYETQPTIMASRLIGERMANELAAAKADGSRIVGYQTSLEQNVTSANSINIVTDRLLLQKLLNGDITRNDAVILDEFHMQKVGTDISLAFLIERGIKTIISSATIDAQKTASRVSQMLGGRPVPVITGTGRTYPITKIDSPDNLFKTITNQIWRLVDEGIENPKSLVFLEGERGINITHGEIRGKLPKGMRLFALTGEVHPKHLQAILQDYPKGSTILATNYPETSVTVPGTHNVFDSCLNRVGDFKRGVKRLPIAIASQSSQDQRAGRVGRTMAGWYFQAGMPGYPKRPQIRFSLETGFPIQTRQEEVLSDQPEITRIDLSDIELRLAKAGFSLLDLNLPKNPSHSVVSDTHTHLRNLGAMEHGTNDITPYGEMMAELNLDPHYARMLVEAMKLGSRVALQAIAVTAAMQVKGIGSTSINRRQWLELTAEKQSDVLAQFDIFMAALKLDENGRETRGIVERRFLKAVTLAETLASQLGLDFNDINNATQEEREQMLQCNIKGAYELFVRSGKRVYRDTRGERRKIGATSVLGDESRLIIGEPIDIGAVGRNGHRFRKGMKMTSAVTLFTLESLVPDRISRKYVGFGLTRTGKIQDEYEVYFDNIGTGNYRHSIPQLSEKTEKFLIETLCERPKLEAMTQRVIDTFGALEALEILQNKTEVDLGLGMLERWLFKQIPETENLHSSLDELAAILTPALIRRYVNEELKSEIESRAPELITIARANGDERQITVKYVNNRAILQVYAGDIVNISPTIHDIFGHPVLVKISGQRRPMTLEVAREHFGRDSRWFRRQSEPREPLPTVGVYRLRSGEDPAHAYANFAVMDSDDHAAEVVVTHFRRKGINPRSRRHQGQAKG